MRSSKTHLPSILILFVFGVAILLLFAISTVLGFSSVINLFGGKGASAAEMISAVAFGFIIVVLLICGWFVLQKARGNERADAPLPLPFALWQIPLVIVLGGTCLIVGAGVTLTEISWLAWLVLPLLTVLIIVPPIWLYFGLGANGIDLGPRWRFFAVFGLGITAAPFMMIVAELITLLLAVIVGSAYLALNQPELFDEITQISRLLMDAPGEEMILELAAPYLVNPVILISGITYIALIVPLIEELLKPLGVWLFAKQLESPAQGYVLGMLSGSAFALFESLNASADGSISWAGLVAARAGTSLLHIAASGLVGWGIASAFKEKRYGRLAGAYLTAVLVHGLWNGMAAAAGITVIGESLGRPEWLFNYTPAMICGLLVMGLGMFFVLIASNRKLKNSVVEALPEEGKVQLSS